MRSHTRPTVLYLDDEAACLGIFALTFREEYEVRTVTTVDEAHRALEGCSFDVVISDQVMPEITGAAFLREVALTHPESARVLLTGSAPVGAVIGEVAAGLIHGFVTKPWASEDIRRALERARLCASRGGSKTPSRY